MILAGEDILQILGRSCEYCHSIILIPIQFVVRPDISLRFRLLGIESG